MALGNVYVRNIFGEPIDDSLDQPPGSHQPLPEPKPSEDPVVADDVDTEIKEEPPSDGPLYNQSSANIDYFQVKEEILPDDLKIELDSSSSDEFVISDSENGGTDDVSLTMRRLDQFRSTPRLYNGFCGDEQRMKQFGSRDYTCNVCEFKCSRQDVMQQHIVMLHSGILLCCDFCDFKSSSERALIAHLKSHGAMNEKNATVTGLSMIQSPETEKLVRQYTCKKCDFKCFSMRGLKSHHSQIHQKKQKYVCYACHYKCNNRVLMKHHILKTHSGVRGDREQRMRQFGSREYTCYMCGFTCSRQDAMQQHASIFHSGILLCCDFCGFKSRSERALAVHLKTHRATKEEIGTVTSLPMIQSPETEKLLREYSCKECDFKSFTKEGLTSHHSQMHQKKKKEYVCHTCHYKCNRRVLIKQHIEKTHLVLQEYNCKECDFKTKSEGGLACHIGWMHKNRKVKYMCYVCNYKCNRRDLIKNHIQKNHTVYPCKDCDFECESKRALAYHSRHEHPVLLRLGNCECYYCHYQPKSNKKSVLKKHILIEHMKERPHVCNLCGKSFKKRYQLNTHLMVHRGEKPYVCTICDYKTARRPSLKRHTRLMHPSEGLGNCECYYCHYRPKSNKKSVLKKHILIEHMKDRPHVCNLCGKSFKKKNHLNIHLMVHRGEKPYVCTICDYKSARLPSVKRHTRLMHPSEEEKLACDHCDFKTPSKRGLLHHAKNEHPDELPYSCEECGDRFGKNSRLQYHLRTHIVSFTCDVCGIADVYGKRMKTHMFRHAFIDFYPDDEKPFHCMSCPYKSDSVESFKSHIVETHEEMKCKVCPYKTNRLDRWKNHSTVHEREKRYCCDICGFRSRWNLKAHILNHSKIEPDEKRFACDLCDFSTNYSHALVKHIRSHLGEKPFACNECNYRSRGTGDLRRHMTIHTGERIYACRFCDYKAARRETWKKHEMTHTGDKPHACKLCSYKAAAKSDLKTHMMRQHTGVKLFRCDACGYKTKLRRNLEIHITRHKGMRRFCCFKCNRICYTRNGIKTHLVAHSAEKEYVCHVCHYKCDRRSEIKRHFERTKEGKHWADLARNLKLRDVVKLN